LYRCRFAARYDSGELVALLSGTSCGSNAGSCGAGMVFSGGLRKLTMAAPLGDE